MAYKDGENSQGLRKMSHINRSTLCCDPTPVLHMEKPALQAEKDVHRLVKECFQAYTHDRRRQSDLEKKIPCKETFSSPYMSGRKDQNTSFSSGGAVSRAGTATLPPPRADRCVIMSCMHEDCRWGTKAGPIASNRHLK